jgi:AhpC/TSA family
MHRVLTTIATIFVLTTLTTAAVNAGDAAPDFTAIDSNGKTEKLSDYKGKWVVLEWTNSGCPFTRKHYSSGNMQNLQKQWTGKGVVWFSVLSSAPGKEGYMTAADENAYLRDKGAAPTAALMDPKGDLGHLYGAKATPHMFVINPKGEVVYAGAIDDRPSTDRGDISGATNYVSSALKEAMSGKKVSTPNTEAYGCSVKYE